MSERQTRLLTFWPVSLLATVCTAWQCTLVNRRCRGGLQVSGQWRVAPSRSCECAPLGATVTIPRALSVQQFERVWVRALSCGTPAFSRCHRLIRERVKRLTATPRFKGYPDDSRVWSRPNGGTRRHHDGRSTRSHYFQNEPPCG